MDRRIKRTKAAVFNAMLDLMVEKDAGKSQCWSCVRERILTKAPSICITKAWRIALKAVSR